ncbi:MULTISPECIES: bifunctional sulfate adenylyltransferase/adenylylsulfate kinase [unclassified Luteibacter]|uniref:bifunctional sulfate adenylyltransferase/adenylylsulfate kinase n=1 Tax=Luteibacter sp. PvP019 TaxID=3156436 RepID=UPI00339A50EC
MSFRAKHTSPLQAPINDGRQVQEWYASDAEAEVLRRETAGLLSVTLNPRQRCDLELILNGGFSPLSGFLGENDYGCVVSHMRLEEGRLWPIPVTLDVSEVVSTSVSTGDRIVLKDPKGSLLAVMTVTSKFRPDYAHEALQVFGTTDQFHPGVRDTVMRQPVCLGGPVKGLERDYHHDFTDLRLSPFQLRAWFRERGWERVVAFQTRNPMHRAHVELTQRALQGQAGGLLLHPVVGTTKPGDVDVHTRVRCYRAVLDRYPADRVKLAVLPLAMRMAGPREALWHALIRSNFGATHFIVGRDHAGPGQDVTGKLFYEPLAAQRLLESLNDELPIQILAFPPMVYSPGRGVFVSTSELEPDEPSVDISGTELRRLLGSGEDLPPWYTYPEVERRLREASRDARRGCVVFLTGLSGAGKSTIAESLKAQLMEFEGRVVTMLDGDEVRTVLSAGLGFSKQDRDANILRIAYVATEVARHGGIAICAPIAPYAGARLAARTLVSSVADFIEVYVSTDIAVCERRDVKGLYAQARAGLLKQFTGIDDPYEVPLSPELRLDSELASPRFLANEIIELLRKRGVLDRRDARHG